MVQVLIGLLVVGVGFFFGYGFGYGSCDDSTVCSMKSVIALVFQSTCHLHITSAITKLDLWSVLEHVDGRTSVFVFWFILSILVPSLMSLRFLVFVLVLVLLLPVQLELMLPKLTAEADGVSPGLDTPGASW